MAGAFLIGNVPSLPSETEQVPTSISSSHLWSYVVKTGCCLWCWAYKQQSTLVKPIQRSFDELFQVNKILPPPPCCTCEYITLHGKGDFADIIKVTNHWILKQGDDPGSSRWVECKAEVLNTAFFCLWRIEEETKEMHQTRMSDEVEEEGRGT